MGLAPKKPCPAGWRGSQGPKRPGAANPRRQAGARHWAEQRRACQHAAPTGAAAAASIALLVQPAPCNHRPVAVPADPGLVDQLQHPLGVASAGVKADGKVGEEAELVRHRHACAAQQALPGSAAGAGRPLALLCARGARQGQRQGQQTPPMREPPGCSPYLKAGWSWIPATSPACTHMHNGKPCWWQRRRQWQVQALQQGGCGRRRHRGTHPRAGEAAGACPASTWRRCQCPARRGR